MANFIADQVKPMVDEKQIDNHGSRVSSCFGSSDTKLCNYRKDAFAPKLLSNHIPKGTRKNRI